MEEREINIEIKKPEVLFLLFILITALIGFPPFVRMFYELPSVIKFIEIPGELYTSLFSPISFGDEGYHTKIAEYIAENVEYPVWTYFEGTKLKMEGFYRPPLYNILQASFLFLFGFNEIWVKLLVPFISFVLGIAAYLLVKKIYNERIALLTAIIAITIPSFVTYSVLFYSDVLATFYSTLFFLILILARKENNRKYMLLSGIFGAFAFLTKITALVVYPLVGFVILYDFAIEKNIEKILRKYALLIIPLVIIPSTFLLRNFYYYGNPTCYALPILNLIDRGGCWINKFEEKYEFPARVEQVGTEQNIFSMGIVNYLEFAYGPIWFVVLTFICGIILFFVKNEPNKFLILTYLALVILILIPATVRAEDTARWTLGWVPIIALVSSVWLDEMYLFMKKYIGTISLIVFILITFLCLQMLASKVSGMKDVKQFSPLFFEACDWIRNNTPKDSLIFTVWSHRAVYNCQRNSVGNMADISVSQDVDYILSTAKQNGITHLFIQKFSLSNTPYAERYTLDFVNLLQQNPDHFKVVYENGPSLDQCIQQGGCDGNVVYEIVF